MAHVGNGPVQGVAGVEIAVRKLNYFAELAKSVTGRARKLIGLKRASLGQERGQWRWGVWDPAGLGWASGSRPWVAVRGLSVRVRSRSQLLD